MQAVRPPQASSMVLPWTHISDEHLYCALDARLGVDLATGVHPWHDQGPQGNDATQATTSKQPAYSTLNGMPSILFDGTDDFMAILDGTGHSAGDDMTVFCVANITMASRVSVFETGTMSNKSDRGVWLDTLGFATDNARIRAHDASGSHIADTTTGFAEAVRIWTVTHEDTNTELFVNGVSSAADTTPTVTLLAQTHVGIGGRGAGSSVFDSHLHSLLIYSTLLSTADIAAVEQALEVAWGL